MEIKRQAIAGTLESGDAQVTIEPSGGGVTFELTSSVINQFGRRIREVATDTLEKLGVKSARVTVVDNGALDYAIRARVECAAFRAAGDGENIPWGELPK
jgi:citrate lyase subunit gamma (acyl carrier protein)